jgi:hypothetical protein
MASLFSLASIDSRVAELGGHCRVVGGVAPSERQLVRCGACKSEDFLRVKAEATAGGCRVVAFIVFISKVIDEWWCCDRSMATIVKKTKEIGSLF